MSLKLPRLRRSVLQEKSIARDLGGRRVAGSGSMPGFKGDAKNAGWLIEAKTTISGKFTLSIGLWRKIESEALRGSGHRKPAMVIEIAGRKLAVIDYNDFLLVQAALTE